MKKLTLKSPAKINLYLKVLGKRPDGYHNIETIFERIDIYDKITLQLIDEDKIEICSESPDIPKDKTNLAYAAAWRLKKDFAVKNGVIIKIEKNIPVGSGLGGGSGDAATVLLGLNRLWRLKLGKNKLLKYARGIGADVSFFIKDTPFAYAGQRGDDVKPLNIKKRLWHILVVPKISVSTAEIYNAFDSLSKKDLQLTKPTINSTIFKRHIQKKGFLSFSPLVYNDLELVTAKRYQQVLIIINKLKKFCTAVAMSGSGSAVFGIVADRNSAYRVKSQLTGAIGDSRIFVAKTC